jgi:hypothetical protein
MRTRHGPLATFGRNLAFRHLSGSEKSDNGAERSTVRNDQKREREGWEMEKRLSRSGRRITCGIWSKIERSLRSK